ncbi:MAG: HAD-IC family P-type ATPase [Patescibacteria group bacterium]|nr:HAD-IC family P-type ATPase [Patescibacteria group bacterium]MDE1965801.1 HAD-IC family P-type ATPase [Patescibacteria group bacterium]
MSDAPLADAPRVLAGLTDEEAARVRARVGENAIAAKKKSGIEKFIKWFFSPIPLMLVAAAALSFASGKIPDGWIILFLLLANYGVQLWHEHKADQAVAKLEEHLAVSANVLRGGAWKTVPAAELVPDDLIALRVGSIVPADAKVLSGSNLSINESMLTGESLPKEKAKDDILYSGSFVVTGSANALVTATGARTYFGTTVKTVEMARKRSALEHDILAISRYLSFFAIGAMVVLTGALLLHSNSYADIATLDISLLIAGIPVALPTVMSLIISAGVLVLARSGAVVRRLSSLEDLANVNLLLSDKTGTLTENHIRVAEVQLFGAYAKADLLSFGASATDPADNNPLEEAVRDAAKDAGAPMYPQSAFIPGDSERKRATATVTRDGESWMVVLGSPSVLESRSEFSAGERTAFTDAVLGAAKRGDRTLAVSVRKGSEKEEGLEPVGLLFLADTLREDAKATVETMREEGIKVTMLTGDDDAIAHEVSDELGLVGDVYTRDIFDDPAKLAAALPHTAAFAEVLPKDKYAAVEAAKKVSRVAVTGDGVNDVPSVADADVGIAVAGSVDALRETADIVLLSNGLSVIATAITEARKVFVRLYHYSVYRMSESFRLILTIAIIGVSIGNYPLTPIQVLLLAFLNDVPIISIAFDRVHVPHAPSSIDGRRRAKLSILYGLSGIANSIFMLMFAYGYLRLPWAEIQTLFFLKLVVSGHLLVYVAHTSSRWFRFLPSLPVVSAVTFTQLLATAWAFFGIFTAPLPLWLIAFVWVWSFFWMQIAEIFKMMSPKPGVKPNAPPLAHASA